MSTPAPYMDKTMPAAQAKAMLVKLGAAEDPARSVEGRHKVFTLRRGGEVMVTGAANGELRLQFYAASCPC